MPPVSTVAFVVGLDPSSAEGDNIGLFWRACLTGAQVEGGSQEMDGDLVFGLSPNPINAYNAAIVDAVIAKAAQLGITLARNSVFFPAYQRGA